MRKAVKFRVIYLFTMAAIFSLGAWVMPESLQTDSDNYTFAAVCVAFFGVVPFLYWQWVIKAGKQKLWKMIIPVSLASLVARFTFPPEFADYFAFISLLKYPVLGVLLIFELFIVFSVVKGLWQARHLSGDPRINILNKYQDKDDKQRVMGLLMAYEPATWYYFIKRFSRNHVASIANVCLLSAQRWVLALQLFVLTSLAALSYWLLMDISEIGATFLAGFILYGAIFTVANYRVSRRYSLYVKDQQLVCNNGLSGLIVIPFDKVVQCESGNWDKQAIDDDLQVGKGNTANIKLTLSAEAQYYFLWSQSQDNVQCVYLNVDHPESVTSYLTAHQSKVDAPISIAS